MNEKPTVDQIYRVLTEMREAMETVYQKSQNLESMLVTLYGPGGDDNDGTAAD